MKKLKNKIVYGVLGAAVLCAVLGLGSIQAHAGLINHYTFDGDANDSQGNAHGTIIGDVTLTTDRFGNADSAYHFAGTNDYIDVGNGSLEGWTQDYSFSAWINPDPDQVASWPTIIGKYTGNSSHETFWFGLYMAGGALATERTDDSAGNIWRYNSAPLGTWQHVAVTYDHSATTLSLYADGFLLNSWTDFGGGTLTNNENQSITIGAVTRSGVVHEFTGSIDDLRIYNTVLSPSEIASLASVPSPSALSLFGSGIVVLFGYMRKRD